VLKPQIDSVSTPDSLTAIFWFNRRYPQQFYDATYHMLIVPEHSLVTEPRDNLRAAAFSRAPIGSGRFRFARWTPGQSIEVVADTTNYRGRPKLDRVIWSITTDPGMSFTRAFAGDVDYAEPLLNPALLPEVAKNTLVVRRATRGADYAFVQFNLTERKSATRPHPLFGDRNLRRALSMALDRQTVVRSVFDTLALVSVGPMTRWQYHADTNVVQIPFDTTAARALLDSLGWRDANGDGIRERNGRPLRFAISIPSSSMTRQRAGVLVQASLKRVGAQVDLDVREPNTVFAAARAGDFDAFMNAIHTDPSPFSMRQSWSSGGARTKGGLNYGMYQNPLFDAYIDSSFSAWDITRVKAMSRKAYDILLADAPAMWLYEPSYSAVVNKRFRVKGMRPDAWWANIDEWSIPANERIARDRIGLATTAR
jgi:peptide/nickel transport system substrate-binding protein